MDDRVATACALAGGRAGGKHKVALSNERKVDVLRRLTRVEAFERYLRKAFLGQKTFSGEGLDVMIPMLEEILHMLGDDDVPNAVIGMAHRGRLSPIAHVVNMPYEEILAEFEAQNDRNAGLGGSDAVEQRQRLGLGSNVQFAAKQCDERTGPGERFIAAAVAHI